MIAGFLRWLFDSPVRQDSAKRPAGRPPQRIAAPPAEAPRKSLGKSGGHSSRRPKLSKEEDDEIRQRLALEIQQKKQEAGEWEIGALFAELIDESQERRYEWLEVYRRYHRTPEWKATRKRVLEKSRHVCSSCGARAEAAHHVRYPSGYGPTLKDFINNEDESLIVAVCHACHVQIHARSIAARKEWIQGQSAVNASADEGNTEQHEQRTRHEAESKLSTTTLASHVPKRPKGFVVELFNPASRGNEESPVPSAISHLATVSLSNPDGTVFVAEYWLASECGRWVIYRLNLPNGKQPLASGRGATRLASASKGPEEMRSAAVYILHDAWKLDPFPSPPTLMDAGVCTCADIRWICSQVWPRVREAGLLERGRRRKKRVEGRKKRR
jgi:5-methylcytosine-specific restriction endonuclease McrA